MLHSCDVWGQRGKPQMRLQAHDPHRFFPFRRQGVTQTADEAREKTGRWNAALRDCSNSTDYSPQVRTSRFGPATRHWNKASTGADLANRNHSEKTRNTLFSVSSS
ncbi:hypothetical protein AVEN_183480-1 [Araneus ventricosus]|uniref:Uncharacterized protein n=1 Tax=Araneus ventricosus TaxID=182803 RepID=A0A4Y1ZJV6_ARAVE|nr:hypothetical protein AVEN_183480-1 [Araneus ventricosus]